MFQLFRSVRRLISAFFSIFSGSVDSARKKMITNPNLVRATYDEAIEKRKQNINVQIEALASKDAICRQKSQRIELLKKKVSQLEIAKTGALKQMQAKIPAVKKDIAALNPGVSEDELNQRIKVHSDYIRESNKYNQFANELNKVKQDLTETENVVANMTKEVAEGTNRLQLNQREIEELKLKREEKVAAIVAARQNAEANRQLAGVDHSDDTRQLNEIDDVLRQLEGEANITSKIVAANDLDAYASIGDQIVSNDEFDLALGLSEKTQPDFQEVTQLPEN